MWISSVANIYWKDCPFLIDWSRCPYQESLDHICDGLLLDSLLYFIGLYVCLHAITTLLWLLWLCSIDFLLFLKCTTHSFWLLFSSLTPFECCLETGTFCSTQIYPGPRDNCAIGCKKRSNKQVGHSTWYLVSLEKRRQGLLE